MTKMVVGAEQVQYQALNHHPLNPRTPPARQDEDVANAIRKQLGHPDFLDTTNDGDGGDGGEGGLKVMDTTATETSTDDECSSDATTASGAGSSATDAEAASNSSVPTATSST